MAMDIHTYICDEYGLVRYKDIWEGRNSNFFANLCGYGDNRIYENFPVKYGLSACAEDEISKKEREHCFDFRHTRVGDFIEWYEIYKPNVTAGWCSKFEAWLYKNKGIIPYNLTENLCEEDIIEDREFIEVNSDRDPSVYFYKFFKNHNVDEDYFLNYFFDN